MLTYAVWTLRRCDTMPRTPMHEKWPRREPSPDILSLTQPGRLALRRAQKVVETMVTDLGCGPPPKLPTRAVAGAWLALRAEAGALHLGAP
jgi:hypothetical protein